MAAKKTDAATKKAAPKATAAKKPVKATAAKTAAAKPAAKPAVKKAVARPVIRTVATTPRRAAQPVAPAAPKKEREVRALPQVPAGHAALIGADGASGETMQLPEILTTATGRSQLLFQAFNAARANARQGNAATKNRARVAGGGAKPWKQKGTGRARAGSTRSPLWRHGGVVFGPNGRTYWQRLPEKMRKAAFAEAFADQAARGRVLVFDALPNGETPKTSAMREWLGRIGDTGKLVIVADGVAETASKALANLPRVELRSTGALRLEDLLNGETLLVARGSIDALAARAGEEKAVTA